MLYKCSKSIENRLKTILKNSEKMQENISKQKEQFSLISRELGKYKEQKSKLKEREKVLKMLCDLIKMEEVRKDLLLDLEGNELEMEKRGALVNEDEYLGKL
jgi:septation ring formation regulator EzrA